MKTTIDPSRRPASITVPRGTTPQTATQMTAALTAGLESLGLKVSSGGLLLKLDDGGRADAGFKGTADDCVTRAIAIATGIPYRDVYDALHARIKTSKLKKHRTRSPRQPVRKQVFKTFLTDLGYVFKPLMGIGTGCKVHLKAGEIPTKGRLIVSCSKHLVAVLDGVIHDTYDPSREGTRCVYGYWFHPED